MYIASYNYGAYLEQAIHSVLRQTLQDFELLIFDDGSTDNSKAILRRYARDERIRVIEQENEGLVRIANKAVKLARGRYLMRLDADDFLDENALLVLSSILDTKKDVDLVYSDYYEIDEEGNVLGIVRRKKIGEESELLDLPAHGACTMVRTGVLRKLGGYSEGLACQDGYDLWIRFIQEHKPYNVNLPLFYYRKHAQSSTTDATKILRARRAIKKRFVEQNGKREP
ncbi:glycosyltransferase, partial [Candidatus Woesearchaeota archaeon]